MHLSHLLLLALVVLMTMHQHVERSGAHYVLAGDCNQIGDFMTAVRDGWMLALATDLRLPATGS